MGEYFGTFVSTFLALSSRPSDPDPCVPQVTFTKFENLKLILTGLVSLSLFLPQSSTWSIFDVFTMKLFNSFVKVTRKALHGFKFFIVFLKYLLSGPYKMTQTAALDAYRGGATVDKVR